MSLITAILAIGWLSVAPALGQSVQAAVNGNPEVATMTVSDLGRLWDEHKIPLLIFMSVVVGLLLWAGKIITPGGLAKVGLRDVTPLPAMVWLFAGLVAMLAAAAAVTIIQQSPDVHDWIYGTGQTGDTGGTGDTGDTQAPPASGASSLRGPALVGSFSFALGILVAWGMLYLLSRSTENAGLKVTPLDVPVGAGCFVLAYPIVALSGIAAVLLYQEIMGNPPAPIAHATLTQINQNRGDPWRWALFFSVVVLAPVYEELVWRGCFQSALLRFTGSPWGAVALTSLGFALIHRYGSPAGAGVPWHALLTLFTLSVAMGIAFERTKRLGVPITMHLCFNALNIAMVLTMPEAGAPAE